MARIKHASVLTREEHREVQLHYEFRRRLPPISAGQGTAVPRVLDWGCGRGSDVLHLRREGYDAYGVEPNQGTIDLGRQLFAEERLDQSNYVRLLGPDNRSDFPGDYFDFLMSYQVLEHVEHLESATAEMHRLLRPGGFAVHLYPSHHRAIEGHLQMPLVHWLPKNGLRRAAIGTWVRLGVHAHWPEIAQSPARVQTATYYAYSCEATHYRPPHEIARIFRAAGLTPQFESHRHARIERLRLTRIVPVFLLSWLLTNFTGCVLVCRKTLVTRH